MMMGMLALQPRVSGTQRLQGDKGCDLWNRHSGISGPQHGSALTLTCSSSKISSNLALARQLMLSSLTPLQIFHSHQNTEFANWLEVPMKIFPRAQNISAANLISWVDVFPRSHQLPASMWCKGQITYKWPFWFQGALVNSLREVMKWT